MRDEEKAKAADVLRRFRGLYGRDPVEGDARDLERWLTLWSPTTEEREAWIREAVTDLVEGVLLDMVSDGEVEFAGVDAGGRPTFTLVKPEGDR